MIPGPFSYHRPTTIADAVKLLSTLGDDARPLAGGHSLIPMMKLRLATPEHLVDLRGIDSLAEGRRGDCRRHREHAVRHSVGKGSCDVIAYHQPILRLRQPAEQHRTSERDWRVPS